MSKYAAILAASVLALSTSVYAADNNSNNNNNGNNNGAQNAGKRSEDGADKCKTDAGAASGQDANCQNTQQ